MSYAQFAYQYAATAGFTPDGIARYRQGEADNQRKEHEAWNGYRHAQDQRALAQQQYADGYAHNQAEAGEVLRGNSSWVDPRTGERRELSYLGDNVSVDPATGQHYYRDASGQYYVQRGHGSWEEMEQGE
jgi:hypothetical protein